MSYGFAAYLVIWLLHPHANAYVVLPWLLLAADRLCERGTVRDAALLGLGLGIAFLGGQPESGLIVSLATAAWVIYRLAGARPARGELVRRVLLGVAAAVLGAGLAAVMLLPLLEAIHQAINSSRAQPPLPARSISALFFPKYWGIHRRRAGPTSPSAPCTPARCRCCSRPPASWRGARAARSCSSPAWPWCRSRSRSTRARSATRSSTSPSSIRPRSPAR